MASGDFRITFEIEPVVKLVCRNINCKFNCMNNFHDRQAHCNLKNIAIDNEGACMNQEPVERIESK